MKDMEKTTGATRFPRLPEDKSQERKAVTDAEEMAAQGAQANSALERMDADYDPVHLPLGRDDAGRLDSDPATRRQGPCAAAPNIPIQPRTAAEGVKPPAISLPTGHGAQDARSQPGDRSDATHDRHDDAFREDFLERHGSESGVSYDQYQPAYHYGNELAWDQRFADLSNWAEVETTARRGWDAKRYGPWARYREAIRFAWDRLHPHVAAAAVVGPA